MNINYREDECLLNKVRYYLEQVRVLECLRILTGRCWTNFIKRQYRAMKRSPGYFTTAPEEIRGTSAAVCFLPGVCSVEREIAMVDWKIVSTDSRPYSCNFYANFVGRRVKWTKICQTVNQDRLFHFVNHSARRYYSRRVAKRNNNRKRN